MLNFRKSTLIKAPVELVWKFYERPDILQLLTPPWQPVEVVRREGGLGVGAVSEFNIYLGPFPVQWIAKHIECEPYRLFVDIQEKGPLESWTHHHYFMPEEGNTRLIDAIAFSLPGGEIPEWILGRFILDRLEDMFTYRHEVTVRECEKLTPQEP